VGVEREQVGDEFHGDVADERAAAMQAAVAPPQRIQEHTQAAISGRFRAVSRAGDRYGPFVVAEPPNEQQQQPQANPDVFTAVSLDPATRKAMSGTSPAGEAPLSS
jgi:hypothetical protein